MNKKSFFCGMVAGVIATTLAVGSFYIVVAGSGMGERTIGITNKINSLTGMLDKYYIGDMDKEQMEEGIYKGLVASLGDVYTSYLTAQEIENLIIDTTGKFAGIGVTVTEDKDIGGLIIKEIHEGSPAGEVGILAGDVIVKIGDVDIKGMLFEDVIKLLRGSEGEVVNVTVFRSSENKELSFDVVRKNIEVNSVESEMLENSIGYIKVSEFKQNTYAQFKKAIEDLKAEGMKGLVVDVRDNPGGSFFGAKDMADLLVGEGIMIYTIDKNGEREDFVSDAQRLGMPLAVLINGNSASASEVLAASIQDMGEGVLVGTQSFGKALVQVICQLPDSSGIRITMKKYYTPSGVSIQGVGLTPDYVVEPDRGVTNSNLMERDNDNQLKKAVEVINDQL